jgi:hypothetical protein
MVIQVFNVRLFTLPADLTAITYPEIIIEATETRKPLIAERFR